MGADPRAAPPRGRGQHDRRHERHGQRHRPDARGRRRPRRSTWPRWPAWSPCRARGSTPGPSTRCSASASARVADLRLAGIRGIDISCVCPDGIWTPDAPRQARRPRGGAVLLRRPADRRRRRHRRRPGARPAPPGHRGAALARAHRCASSTPSRGSASTASRSAYGSVAGPSGACDARASRTSSCVTTSHTPPPVVTDRYLQLRSRPPMPHQETHVHTILEAIQSGDATSEDFAALELPESYRAVTVHKDEVDMFEGLTAKEKDPRKSLHVEEVALPELGPGEALRRGDGLRDQLQHRVDLDLRARLHLRLPRALRPPLRPHQAPRPALPRGRLRPGRRRAQDRPRRHEVEARRPRSSRTASRSSSRTPTATTTRCSTRSSGSGASRPTSAAWPTIALVKSNQLMPKPAHLTWEEAASPGLVNSTAYRQLVSKNGGDMKQGDNVLIWGASGGLGGFATQYALNGGAIPVCVVSNEEKAAIGRTHGRRAGHQPLRGGLQVLERRGHAAGPQGVEALRRQDPRAHRRRGHRHRLRAPRPRDLRRLGLRHPQGRHHHHLRLHQRLHARVRQPLPVDEPQADHLLATSPTTASPGRPTASSPRA